MIWMLRHAEAADGRPDEARPLTPRGLEQSRIARRALKRLGVHVDACLSSPKRRAMETAELACGPLALDVVTEPALAGAAYDPEQLAAGLGDVMIVGHNPAMSTVVHDMTGARGHLRKGGAAAV